MLLAETIYEGILVYFDQGLGKILLYAFEREQYVQVRDRFWDGEDVVLGNEKEMSEIYGAEHLLRLLGKF
jgi:mortality factor 4-like protein 1